MGAGAASGATWGITGPAFLAIYTLALAVALLVMFGIRASLRSARVLDPEPGPYQLAYLSGQEQAAVAAAVAALRVDGVIAVGYGALRLVRDGPARQDPLEEAVRQAIGHGAAIPYAIRAVAGVLAALAGLRDQLVRSGLLLSPGRRRWIRSTAALPAALLVLGIVRYAAGHANHKPTRDLAVLLTVTVLATAAALLNAPRVSSGGRRAVRQARRAYGYLNPSQRPAWPAYGGAAAATSVALFGTAALAAVDNGLAAIPGLLPPERSGSGFAWYGAGGGGGGGGGCGGGCGGGGCGG